MTARADLRRALTLAAERPTKTFVVDVHSDDPSAYLVDLFGSSRVEPTDDASLFAVHVASGTFWVDQLDARFWSFHTEMSMKEARGLLHEQVERRRDFDWVWLPSMHLRRVAPAASARSVRTGFRGEALLGSDVPTSRLNLQAFGTSADEVVRYLEQSEQYRSSVSLDSIQVVIGDDDEGWLNEAVSRLGRFVAYGEGLELHFQFVRAVVSRYAALVSAVERSAMFATPLDESREEPGGRFGGRPIVLKFSRDVPDMERFVDELFSCRTPFRMWGSPEGDGDITTVDAVDLHIGRLVRLDIGQSWMRIYLESGSCGNSVVRLISNLQHRFDSAISIVDRELDGLLTAHQVSLGASEN